MQNLPNQVYANLFRTPYVGMEFLKTPASGLELAELLSLCEAEGWLFDCQEKARDQVASHYDEGYGEIPGYLGTWVLEFTGHKLESAKLLHWSAEVIAEMDSEAFAAAENIADLRAACMPSAA